MKLVTATEPYCARRPTSLRPEVDEHHVLGALLLVGEQLGGEARVLVGRRAARPGARDRAHDHAVVADAHQQLRRAADELHAVEREVVHVGRRVERAQRTIERRGRKSCGTVMRRARRTWKQSPARMYSLIRSTSATNRARVQLDVPRAGGAAGSRSSAGRARGRAEPRDRRVDLARRGVVERAPLRVGRAGRDRHTHDDAGLGPEIVDHHHRAREHEQRVGQRVPRGGASGRRSRRRTTS
jgi:hypothetical protein